MVMDGLKNSTVEWYVGWLESTRPDLTTAQRYELAVGFTAAQCSPPPVLHADDEVTVDDIKALSDATDRALARKNDRAEQKLSELLKQLQDEKPIAKLDVLRDRPRRLADFKG